MLYNTLSLISLAFYPLIRGHTYFGTVITCLIVISNESNNYYFVNQYGHLRLR